MKINKNALLIIAHGSRKKVSNIEIHQLANRILISDSGFDIVQSCFLDIAEPSIPEGLKICANQNPSSIIVFPYFLAAGRHVIEDIPEIIEQEKPKYPGISIKSVPYLGSSPLIVDIIKTLAENNVKT